MLRELTTPFHPEHHPWRLLATSVLFSSLAILTTLIFFPNRGGVNTVLLSILVFIPVMYHALLAEERKDTRRARERHLLKEHGRVLAFLFFIFLGNVLSFFAWSLLLPLSLNEDLFAAQRDTIATAQHSLTSHATTPATLATILTKNLKVTFFALLFSILFGFGSLYIVTWNASVIAIAMADFARTSITSTSLAVLQSFTRYLLHGIPEILGFFTAGLAGGILYIAIIRKDIATPRAPTIAKDVLTLTANAVLLILVAALIEVYVTPLFF